VSAPPASEELARQGRPRVPLLGFRQPEPEEETPAPAPATPPLSGTIPSPASSPESTSDHEHEPASEHDEMPDEQSESPAGTRSTGSSRATKGPVGQGLQDLARNGIIIATEQVHTYVGSRTAGQRAVELYRADADDAERIGDPLARIAARRDGVGEMSPDTEDLLAAMMGLAGYAAKQIQRKAIADKIDAREAGGLGDVQPMPDHLGDVA